MTAAEQLRRRLDEAEGRLRAAVPGNREAALVALIHARDRRAAAAASQPPAMARRRSLITGMLVTDLGGNLALRLCLEAGAEDIASPPEPGPGLAAWATELLADCDQLGAAELVLAQAETGFMRLVSAGDDSFAAWIATKRTPAAWWERADIAWWAAWLAARPVPPAPAALAASGLGADPATRPADVDAGYRALASTLVERMSYQFPYPPAAIVGGLMADTYRAVLVSLLARALRGRDRGEPTVPHAAPSLIAAVAAATRVPFAAAARAVAGFTLDRAGAAYHAAVPGIAAAPLVEVAPGQFVWSMWGLMSEPLLFLARELRRRDAESYHNAAHQRETVFRDDLYGLFADKRFVTSPGRIELRRTDGNARTDLDAVVFDRKTGALAFFELKSQDPFARSAAEQARQRDNVLHANRQVAGTLDWLKRHGADALLSRVDAATAKRFRVQQVYPFVLGRYLAHFLDGAPPDRRAAWGTWPQVLRLRAGEPFGARDANPLSSFFTRLTKDEPPIQPPATTPAEVVQVGGARLTVHASFAAFQASAGAG